MRWQRMAWRLFSSRWIWRLPSWRPSWHMKVAVLSSAARAYRHTYRSRQHSTSMQPCRREGVPSVSCGDMQARGSAISFLRRYAISSVLNIAVQDDDDGNIVVGNEYQQQDKKTPGEVKEKPKPKEKPKGASRPVLEAAKVAYFELIKSTASFPNDKEDVARHAWQKLVAKKASTKAWSQTDFDRATLMLNWRMIVGEESDVLVEYLEKHRTKPKDLGNKFLDIMGVGQLTEIQDITNWAIAMSAALQYCNKQEPAAIDMGRALLRAAQHEGLVGAFLKVCEVDKVSKLTKEQIVEWKSLLEKSIAEWIEAKGLDDTQIPDVASILGELGKEE